MMLKLTVLVMVVVATVLAADEKYMTRLDSINVDEVIANDRLFDAYVNCFLEKGKCTPLAKTLKENLIRILPEILETNCAKCTQTLIIKARKILTHLRDHKREKFDQLLDMFDHNKELRKKYKNKYSELAKKEGFSDIFE